MERDLKGYIRDLNRRGVDGLPDREIEQLKDLPRISNLESQGEEIIAGAKKKNPTAQRIIKAMEKPPYVTHEDIESLLQVIKEAKQPTRFESSSELSSKIR